MILLLSFLLLATTSQSAQAKCFINGRCSDSQILSVKTTNNEIDCLQVCIATANCKWFSYNRKLLYLSIIEYFDRNNVCFLHLVFLEK